MIITKITFPSGKITLQLEPERNYKYITNGNIWSNLVVLGKTDNVENWHDTNEEPPEEIVDEENESSGNN